MFNSAVGVHYVKAAENVDLTRIATVSGGDSTVSTGDNTVSAGDVYSLLRQSAAYTTENKVLRGSIAFQYDGEIKVYSSDLYYSMTYPAVVKIDTDDFVYDAANDMYYVTEEMEVLSGIASGIENAESATWKVYDPDGKILNEGTFSPATDWSVSNIGLVLGENVVEVEVNYVDGVVFSDAVTLINLSEENMSGLDIDLEDSDGDGLPDFIELDSLGSDPINIDSDGDGITNLQEQSMGTDLINIDSDGDTLKDGDEIGFGTSPLKEDTDDDTLTDDYELAMGYNPLVADDLSKIITKTYTQSDFNIMGTDVGMTIELEAALGGQVSFMVDLADNELINSGIAGYIGEAYDFTMSGTFESVWENEIKKPGTENSVAKDLNLTFVIDVSGSMSGSRISTVKQVMKQFISSMGEADQAAIVRYESYAYLSQGMTNNKDSLTTAVNNLYASGGTSIYRGVALGIEQLTKNVDENSYDILILLTDGQDSSFNSYWERYAKSCVENNIIVYSVGIGSGVSSSHLTKFAEATGGKYYHAEIVGDLQNQFEEIKGETVDYTHDENDDGISDYYTKLICEGKLTTCFGEKLFSCQTYEDVQKNKDWDGDGLKNGDEIEIVNNGDRVYVLVRSYPDTPYSDSDIYTDKEEKDYGTDPLRENGIFLESDIDYVTNDDNFVSEQYRELYNGKVLGKVQKFGIWLGNNVFGNNYDKVYIYKSFLISYFDKLYNESIEKEEWKKTLETGYKIVKEMQQSVNNTGESIKKLGIDSAQQQLLADLTRELGNAQAEMTRMIENADVLDRARFYELCNDTYDTYRNASNQIPKLEKKIEYISKLKKAGEVAEKIGYVFDVVSAGQDVYNVWKDYGNFAASMEMIADNIYLLDEIAANTSDKKLKSACNELRAALYEQSELNSQKWEDVLQEVGMEGGKIALAAFSIKIPVVGKYVAAAVAVVGVLDWALQTSEIAKQNLGLYALSSAATYMADDLEDIMNRGQRGYKGSEKTVVLYNNIGEAANRYYNLCLLRCVAEEQMKKADKAKAWYIEWLFTNVLYKVSDIEANINTLNQKKNKYLFMAIEE